MQIGAVSEVGFKGSQYGNYKNDFRDDAILNGVLLENEPDEYISSDDIIDVDAKEEPVDIFEQVKRDAENKARQNVHPSTIVVGALTLLACYKAGHKAAGYIINGGIKAGEFLAKGAVKAAESVTGALSKKTDKIKSFDSSKLVQKISETSKKLLSDEPNEKMINTVRNITKDVTASDIEAEKAVKFMKGPFGIKNAKDIAKAAVALSIGWKAADTSSDVVEQAADMKDVTKALSFVMDAV